MRGIKEFVHSSGAYRKGVINQHTIELEAIDKSEQSIYDLQTLLYTEAMKLINCPAILAFLRRVYT